MFCSNMTEPQYKTKWKYQKDQEVGERVHDNF